MVGPSLFDPEGKGHHGHEGIGAFWDLAIAGVRTFLFTITDSFANGDSCANVGTITSVLEDGTRIGHQGLVPTRVLAHPLHERCGLAPVLAHHRDQLRRVDHRLEPVVL